MRLRLRLARALARAALIPVDPLETYMSWRTARALDVLLAEVNAAAPNRNKSYDGSIGDTAHAARVSDHNPNAAGVVRARDITDDPAHGCDADVIAAQVAALLGKHPALMTGAYVIRSRRIISADRLREGWRAYTGTNPHDHHVHVSVTTVAGSSGYDSTKAWGVLAKPKPAPMPTPRRMIRALGRRNAERLWRLLNKSKP